jgi:thiol:disulfide interchange protein
MKTFGLSVIGCLLAGQLFAADAQWLTSVPDALAVAKKEHKLVLLDFTGSDWCEACKRLEVEAFSKPEFADYAKKNLVLVQLDFPTKPQPAALAAANQDLYDKYRIEGFPTLILLKPDGHVVWNQLGYTGGGPPALIAKVDEAKAKPN